MEHFEHCCFVQPTPTLPPEAKCDSCNFLESGPKCVEKCGENHETFKFEHNQSKQGRPFNVVAQH